MAAIAGVLHADPDRRVDRSESDAMVQRFAVHPGHTLEAWTVGAAYLACAGSKYSNLRGPGSGLKIVADTRLDDRATLAKALGLDAARASDIELIEHAYRRWGVNSPDHLTGDFAFAIWDPDNRRLYCARDQLGVRPFYYRHDRTGLAFASRLNVVARQGDTLSQRRVAGYLAGIEDSHDDTVFGAIQRLPMGCWLLWSADRLVVERYGTLAADAIAPNEDVVAGFRERFLDAVDDRSQDEPDLGAMLSGGLDSSSIVSAVARRGGVPLRTFSFAYPRSPRYDETDYAAAVASQYGLRAEFIGMDDVAPLGGLADLADGMDDLFFAPGLPKVAQLLATARKSGVRAMLDGHGGDEVVSHGFGRLDSLARERRWLSLYRELRGVSAISGDSAVGLLWQYYLSQGLAARARRGVGRHTGSTGGRAGDTNLLLNHELIRETALSERIEQWTEDYRRAAGSEATLHLWNVSSPPVARSFEALRRAGDQVGVELRFPFYDRRLVSYALAIPEGEKLKDGWTRSVLRRAMQDILPEKVQWRRTKSDFGTELSSGLARHHAELLHEIFRSGAPVGEYIDLESARYRVESLIANPSATDGLDLFALWRAVFLALWLNNRSTVLQPAKVMS